MDNNSVPFEVLTGVNKLSILLFIVSLAFAGPVFTLMALLLLGFFSGYTRPVVGASLASLSYSLLGFLGLIMFKLGCLFTLGVMVYNDDTIKKLNDFRSGGEFSDVSNGISYITDEVNGNYTGFRENVIDTLVKTRERLYERYPRLKTSVDTTVNVSCTTYGVMGLVGEEIKCNALVVHNTLYNSGYDVYVKVSDYGHMAYMMYKLCKILLKSNQLLKMPMMDRFEGMMSGAGQMNQQAFMPQSEEDAKELVKDISQTLQSLTSLMGDFGGMGMNQMGESPNQGMVNPFDLFGSLGQMNSMDTTMVTAPNRK